MPAMLGVVASHSHGPSPCWQGKDAAKLLNSQVDLLRAAPSAVVHHSKAKLAMSPAGLGCVETPGEMRHKVVEVGEAR